MTSRAYRLDTSLDTLRAIGWSIVLLSSVALATCGTVADSPLAAAVDPGIALPAADMARSPTPELLEQALVVRLPREGFRPAIRSVDGKRFPNADRAGLRDLIRAETRRVGHEDAAPRRSRLQVILWVDADTEYRRVTEVLCECADPEVRALHTWIAARDHEGRLAILPFPLPQDRCICGKIDDHRDPTPSEVHRVRIRRADPGSGLDEGALYAWCYRAWRAAELPVLLMIDPRADTPFRHVVAAANEARRFGFGTWPCFPGSRDEGVGAWTFVVAPSPTAEAVTVPDLRPGVAIAGDPRVAPTGLATYGEGSPPIEMDEMPVPDGDSPFEVEND